MLSVNNAPAPLRTAFEAIPGPKAASHGYGMLPLMSTVDRVLSTLDNALRTTAGASHASRPCPQPTQPGASAELTQDEKRLAGALMRVNHVGEICAQALYQSQALATRDPELRAHFEEAAREEMDHLAWTKQRLDELNDRPSLLNPLWYAGAFALGMVMGRVSDRNSLGFVVETERQVESHLHSHLERLPEADTVSRVIVQQMKEDEQRHADAALNAGAAPLSTPVQGLMRLAAKVMTTVAHRI